MLRGGIIMNKGIIKKMLSIICAISAIGSAVGSVGAAGDDAEANKILSDINKCDTEIENLKDLKAKIEEEKEHELQEIKKKISENKQVVD